MLSLRTCLAVLIVAATALLVIGISIEKAEGGHPEEGAAQVESGERSQSEGDEAVLGVELESTPFIVLAALASLALAAAAWKRPDSEPLLLLVALVMLAFAVFDLAEIGHQVEESEAGLVIVAGLVAVLHLAASAVTFTMRRRLGEPAPA